MRRHLERCFENEKLTPFPPTKMPVQKCRGKHDIVFIHVYCVCGLPERYDTQMIECEQCQKWFHFKCMKLVTEPDSWVCLASSPGHSQILSHSRGEKSGEGLVPILRHGPEMVDSILT